MEGVTSLRFEALGGDCELYALEPAEPLEVTAGWIRGLHQRLTRFDPDSEVARLNVRAGDWVDVSPELHELLVGSLAAFEESTGLVNVAILPALVAAGYDRTFDEISRPGLPSGTHAFPHRRDDERHQIDDRTLAPAEERARPGERIGALPGLLQLRPGSARLAPGTAIDLGGLAKGWIADRAVERLGPNSLANCAGDLRAIGGGPGGEGWPVAFGGKTLLLNDHGAATSGTTKRRWGEGRHHLIDPRTGAPAITDLSEVSVLAPTALEAEVLAKTALLLGSLLAPRHLEGHASAWALS